MYDNEFETRNIKFKPIMKLNHNIYIILAVLIDSDQERISLRASSPIWASLARMRERGAAETKLVTQTKRVPAWPVINQLCFPERHFSANGISLRLSEVQMKFYERSLQALLSSAPRGFAARSRVLARLASLAQIGELARRLRKNLLFSCSDAWNPWRKAISQFRITVYTAFSRMSALVPISTYNCLFTDPLFPLQSRSRQLVIEYKQQAIYWPPAQGGSVGEEENRRARSRARLRAVPQDGHASEEIERSERKPRGSWEGGGKGGREGLFFSPLSSFPLGQFALSSPAELRLYWLTRDCSQSIPARSPMFLKRTKRKIKNVSVYRLISTSPE